MRSCHPIEHEIFPYMPSAHHIALHTFSTWPVCTGKRMVKRARMPPSREASEDRICALFACLCVSIMTLSPFVDERRCAQVLVYELIAPLNVVCIAYPITSQPDGHTRPLSLSLYFFMRAMRYGFVLLMPPGLYAIHCARRANYAMVYVGTQVRACLDGERSVVRINGRLTLALARKHAINTRTAAHAQQQTKPAIRYVPRNKKKTISCRVIAEHRVSIFTPFGLWLKCTTDHISTESKSPYRHKHMFRCDRKVHTGIDEAERTRMQAQRTWLT